ncbi:MAG TPA: hypothetical protein VMJ72_02590 [Candidatus Paceibacterota bacterium]|nr:hypothetical protein [Candidatus Paceibacterota bacterium]
MAKHHTTAANPVTYLHTVLAIAVAVLLAMRVPYAAGSDALDYIAPRAVNLGILFSIVVGFLMYKSLTRRSDIDNSISRELNKVRRMYHLARHIAKAQPAADTWYAAVRGGIREYLGLFRTLTLHEYDLGNPLFRSVTYAVYSLPSQAAGYDPQLYQSLLDATGEATEAREFIRAKKDDQISWFSWIVVVLVSLVFSVLIIAATPQVMLLRWVGASVILCLFLVLQLIYEHDRTNSRRDRNWAVQYVENLTSLDRAERMR